MNGLNQQYDTQQQVNQLVLRARNAQKQIASFTQQQIDLLVTAIAWAVIEPENNQALAQLAVQETGMGNVADKMAKNQRKTLGLLRDLQGKASVGVIREDPLDGIIEIAQPVGVVAALTPATHPVAVTINNIINAIKGRNAIIVSPSPKGVETCALLVSLIYRELDQLAAPRDLVLMLPPPACREMTEQLMRAVDLVIVTGSQNNVAAAQRSGTPTLGVGVGNVAAIVTSSADIALAAQQIAASKCFDNATSCSSENSVLVVEPQYQPLLDALSQQGGVLLTAQEKQQLQTALWPQGNHQLSRQLVGRSASQLAQLVGLTRPACHQARFFLVQEQGVGADFPFSGEKLSPVLTLYRVADFPQALSLVSQLYRFQGAGHSVGIHSHDDQEILQAGLQLAASRVIVNQSHCLAAGGSFTNSLPFSLSLGCGSWGKNLFSDNLNYQHFFNRVRIVRAITTEIPTIDSLFVDYLRIRKP
jgi:sulfoacetaldehyde dehydrogenase